MMSYKVVWVSEEIRNLVKPHRPPVRLRSATPGHQLDPRRNRFSVPHTLEALLHWFLTLPCELQEDLVAFYREEKEVLQDGSLAVHAA